MSRIAAAHERYRLAVLELKVAAELLDVLEQPVCPVRVRMVQLNVADRFGVRLGELWGPKRTDKIATARFVAMYLLRTVLKIPANEIGTYFKRDRTSVSYALSVVANRCATEKKFRAELEQLQTASPSATTPTQHIDHVSESTTNPAGGTSSANARSDHP